MPGYHYNRQPHQPTDPPAPTPNPGGFDAALADVIAETIARNVASIEALPRDVLPDSPARRYLLHLAGAGHDCYAYLSGGHRDSQTPQGQRTGSWCLWIEPLTRICNGRDGRIPVLLWLQTWQWIAPAIHCAIAHASTRTSGPLSL
ncbi:MAG TPA: hypothetical protein VGR57_15865 [Ktedonobacterales bacterium]|nr:hypothetical protein [Ktedonobacterales bacterium]